MKTKTETQRFVFSDMGYQDFPHTTNRECIVVEKSLDLINKKVVDGELVDKTSADLEVEESTRRAALDEQYKAQRKDALSSPDLTIYYDSTLSQSKVDAISRIRQEWYNMTTQTNYPFDFMTPTLQESL